MNVDRSCNVESVLELAVLAPQQVSKKIMDKHVQILQRRSGHVFAEFNDDTDKTSMVQLSRQENYADQFKALELNIYVFGFNKVHKQNQALPNQQ